MKNPVDLLRAIWLSGSRYYCPLCNGHFRALLSCGAHPRQNAMCPRCGSVERHRLLWLYLKDRTDFFSRALTVLDVAPMNCFQDRCRKLPNLKYISVDISSKAAMIRADVEALSFAADRFDCIFCYHVFEHVGNDRKAIQEIFRVLKPGGWAILQSPLDWNREATIEDPSVRTSEGRARMFGQSDHLRDYGRDYVQRLSDAGFKVRIDDYAQRLDIQVSSHYGLMRDEAIFFCTKPK